MTKSKTHYPQVPVEIAKRVARVESNGHSLETLGQPKNGSKGDVLAADEADRDEDEGVGRRRASREEDLNSTAAVSGV